MHTSSCHRWWSCLKNAV
uniref:Uncharacterized protein n=1 Tax=Arundo donax TaxID=35708 RepID=A0A0A8ZF31_ARUDO